MPPPPGSGDCLRQRFQMLSCLAPRTRKQDAAITSQFPLLLTINARGETISGFKLETYLSRSVYDALTFENGKGTVSALIQIPSKMTHKGTGTQVNSNIFIK